MTTGRTTEPPGPAQVKLTLSNYTIVADVNTVTATAVALTVTNEDDAPHNVVLLRSLLPPDQLPTTGIRLDEASPDIVVLAGTPPLSSGATETLSVVADPGTYVLVCTIPHHYVRSRMFATFSVR